MALGNLGADNPLIKEKIIMNNGIDVLTTIFYTLEDRRSCENCAWAISNLGRRSNNNRQISSIHMKKICECIGDIFKMQVISLKKYDHTADLLWTIANISESGRKGIQLVIDQQIMKYVMKYASDNSNYELQTPALRIIGNFSTGN
jgi:hypothetical protein